MKGASAYCGLIRKAEDDFAAKLQKLRDLVESKRAAYAAEQALTVEETKEPEEPVFQRRATR